MNWISDNEATKILEVTRQRLAQYRNGYNLKQKGKMYFIKPKFPESAWRYTAKIEYDEEFIRKFKAEKDGKTD